MRAPEHLAAHALTNVRKHRIKMQIRGNTTAIQECGIGIALSFAVPLSLNNLSLRAKCTGGSPVRVAGICCGYISALSAALVPVAYATLK